MHAHWDLRSFLMISRRIPLLFRFFVLYDVFRLHLFSFLSLRDRRISSLSHFFLIHLRFSRLLTYVRVFNVDVRVNHFSFSRFVPNGLVRRISVFLQVRRFLVLILPISVSRHFTCFARDHGYRSYAISTKGIFTISKGFPLRRGLIPIYFSSM